MLKDVFDIFALVPRQRIDLDPRTRRLDHRKRITFATVEAFAPGQPGVIALKRTLKRLHLAQIAAFRHVRGKQHAVGILGLKLFLVRAHDLDIGQAQMVDQLFAIGMRFAKQLAGIKEDHRQITVDLGHQRQKGGGLCPEG